MDEFKEALKQLSPAQQQEVSERARIIASASPAEQTSLMGELTNFLLNTGIAINQNLIANFIWEMMRIFGS